MNNDWSSLPLPKQIAQMIMVRASGYLYDHQIRYPAWEANNAQLEKWLGELNLGGVILLGGSSVELQARSRQLQSWANVPLFVAADVEEGIGQRFPGGTWFPPPMALGAIYDRDRTLALEYAEQMGAVTAREAVATGVNWLLAPVVDVNNNPDNPVINIRAFGDRPEVVSALTAAFIKGAKSYPVLTTAKHFPGHGDTATDSHLDLPTLNHSEARLKSVELPPFENAIASGVDGVMTAHLVIPAWDKAKPATLSPSIMTQKLREQMGFTGLIVTDALIMGGITKYAPPEQVAVIAVEAGCDILLMPDDPEIAIAAISAAVESGRISQSRINESLERIWQAKQKLIQTKQAASIASPLARDSVRAILVDSLQTKGKHLAANNQQSARNLIVVDDVLNAAYLDLNSPAIAIPQKLNYARKIVDSSTLNCALSESNPTLLQVFIRGNPFRGNAGLTSHAKNVYRQMIADEAIVGMIIYGSPYVFDWFKSLTADSLPLVYTYGQMPQAQSVALQKLFNLHPEELESPFSSNFGF